MNLYNSKKNMPMNHKDKKEFAYHIVKNLLLNYIIFFSHKNKLISKSRIKIFLLNSFNEDRDQYHLEKLMQISKIKEDRRDKCVIGG